MILNNIETGEFRYFKAFSSDTIFDLPITISRYSDLGIIDDDLNSIDIVSQMTAYYSKTSVN